MTKAPAWLIELVRLTRQEYFADFFITPPITLGLTIYSIVEHGFGLLWLPQLFAGWFAWTLYEYAIHVASHHLPWLIDIHRLHHRNQRDYIALHPALTLTFYAATWLAFGFAAAPFAIGFSVGYVVYAALHTAFHHAEILEGGWLARSRRPHVTHHRCHDRCFGVTTQLWDRLFGTA